jgi:hypothetical protein
VAWAEKSAPIGRGNVGIHWQRYYDSETGRYIALDRRWPRFRPGLRGGISARGNFDLTHGSSTQTFLQPQHNAYVYAWNSPNIYGDPTGLFPWDLLRKCTPEKAAKGQCCSEQDDCITFWCKPEVEKCKKKCEEEKSPFNRFVKWLGCASGYTSCEADCYVQFPCQWRYPKE